MKNTILILTLFFLLACNVQKRKYQKGYYVSRISHSSQQANKPVAERRNKVAINTPTQVPEHNIKEAVFASAGKDPVPADPKRHSSAFVLSEDSCDVLILKDGSEIKVKIMEVNDSQVKYKKCAMSEGPLYISNKSEIFMIKYASGLREVVKVEAPPKPAQEPNKPYEKGNRPDDRVIHPLAVLSFVFGIIGCYPILLFGSILGLVFGGMAIKRIKAQPEKYKGLGLARAGRIMGMISLIALGVLFTILIIGTLMFI